MKLIITGASGFVGSAVSSYLLSKSHQLITAGRSKNDEIFFDPTNECSSKKPSWPMCDAFIHIASANELICSSDPRSATTVNVFGTQQALQHCVTSGIEKFVYISTFHVYGRDIGKIDEDSITEPTNYYGLTHLFAEQLVKSYAKTYKLNALILRPSNLFGIPKDICNFNRWSLIPFDFCKHAVMKRKIILKTTGDQSRNFVHVDLLAKAIEKYLTENQRFDIKNIAGTDTLSVRDFANLVSMRASYILGLKVRVLAPKSAAADQKLVYFSKFNDTDCNQQYSIATFVDSLLRTVYAELSNV